MRETTILASEGFLGPFAPKLEVGDIQSMVFDRPTDVGPWYLSSEERETRRHNQSTGQSKRIERTKKLLVDALESSGIILQNTGTTQKRSVKNLLGIMESTFTMRGLR